MSDTEMSAVSRTSLSREETGSVRDGPSQDLPLEEQVKELREERKQLTAMYDMVSIQSSAKD